jgi:plastocyanin
MAPAYPVPSPRIPGVLGNVAAKDNSFDPNTLRIRPGTTVRWTNVGMHLHTVTSSDGKFDSGDIPHGGYYEVQFVTPGTYRYHCKHHKGMEGTIVVGEPGPGPEKKGK